MSPGRKGWVTRRRNRRRQDRQIDWLRRHLPRCRRGCVENIRGLVCTITGECERAMQRATKEQP